MSHPKEHDHRVYNTIRQRGDRKRGPKGKKGKEKHTQRKRRREERRGGFRSEEGVEELRVVAEIVETAVDLFGMEP